MRSNDYVPVPNFEALKVILDTMDDPYPFYSVMLYTRDDGLNARLRSYVRSHWLELDSLTGDNCFQTTIEGEDELQIFKPEDIYHVARFLGASVDTIPSIVFFTEPHVSRKTQILKLRDILSEPDTLSDEKLTDFFQSIQSIVDKCSDAGMTADKRLECFRKGLDKEWPLVSHWADRANKVKNWVASSFSTTTNIALAVDQIVTVLKHLGLV